MKRAIQGEKVSLLRRLPTAARPCSRALRPAPCALRSALLALGAGLCPAAAAAQFPDLLDASAQDLPGVALDEPRPARAQLASYEGTLNIPAFADVRYTFGGRVELGLRADVAGNAHVVRDERIRGASPCTAGSEDPSTPVSEALAQPEQCFDHIAYSVAVVGVVAGVRLFSSVWWTALVGHSVFRRFDQRNADDERISGGLQAMPDAPLVRTSRTWRIPRDWGGAPLPPACVRVGAAPVLDPPPPPGKPRAWTPITTASWMLTWTTNDTAPAWSTA